MRLLYIRDMRKQGEPKENWRWHGVMDNGLLLNLWDSSMDSPIEISVWHHQTSIKIPNAGRWI